MGIYPYAAGVTHEDSFKDWFGWPAQQYIEFFNSTVSWADARSQLAGAVQRRIQKPARIDWAMPLTVVGTSLLDVANGSNDSDFAYFAETILLAQSSWPIQIRLGWEMNGTWYPWAGMDKPMDYISAWRRVVGLIKGISNRFVFTWSPNWTWGENGVITNPEVCYPGDNFVDYIGMSCYFVAAYDNENPYYAWLYKKNSPYGLDWLVAFAKKHGKPPVISEWGISRDGAQEYVKAFGQYLIDNNFAWANYWDANNDEFVCRLSDGQYPDTGKQFKQTFSS